MRDVYLVTYRPGRTLAPGTGAHSEVHLAIEAESAQQVRSLLASEPRIKAGRLEIVSLKQLLLPGEAR